MRSSTSSLAVAASRFVQLVSHVLWPISCPICGRIGSNVCPECLLELADNSPRQICVECMGFSPCLRHPESVSLSYMSSFRGGSRDLVHMLKYGGRRELGRLMGRAMGEVLPVIEDAVLVPVPLHGSSERAFNQSKELSKGISEVWGVSIRDAIEWRIPRISQVGLSSHERKNMPPDAMKWKGAPARRVCIIDDVCTTGATLRCAIRAVVESGGTVAGALTWAFTS